MEPARSQTGVPTAAQTAAIEARGNVLVMAGAGTGKTRTLVSRCVDCLNRERASLDQLLIVTFTEAAAAEMRLRLRRELEKKAGDHPADDFWQHQLALFDVAHIGTLHSFCLKLVREHFHELGLDPQLVMLDEGQARQLAGETLDTQFLSHYESDDEVSLAFQDLIQVYGNGTDEKISPLVLRLHNYSQTRPDAERWLADQLQKFAATEPGDWKHWLMAAVSDWREQWLAIFAILAKDNVKAAELISILRRLPEGFTRDLAAQTLEQVLSADAVWPAKSKVKLRKPLEKFFGEAGFLHSLAACQNGLDPLTEDWGWIRGHMAALLRLAQEFAASFSERKRALGALDFHDLEQFALQLLWDQVTGKHSNLAELWRQSLRFVFVDEYQDINAAQDKIIAALSREGAGANRFLVGDVKQSIYRFRLADPKIFRDYAGSWSGTAGHTIPLAENFRSRESLLNFVNSFFRLVMRPEIGGVAYDDDAALKYATHTEAAPAKIGPRTCLLLRRKSRADEPSSGDGPSELAGLEDSAREARLIAQQLKAFFLEKHEVWDAEINCLRAVQLSDMAILLRSPRNHADIFAREFQRAGVPLSIARTGFYESAVILDFVSLLQLLDNPLQDVPCIAVLRSPLAGLSLDELAEIRLSLKKGHFWTAMAVSLQSGTAISDGLRTKLDKFHTRFLRWRKLARQVSLSQCLEQILAETYYGDWLKTRPRGEQQAANLEVFLQLARQFDQFQRQGLFRFLKFIETQQEIDAEPEAPSVATGDAVRLMSIHQSKGLEFPVVVVAGLDKKFNEQDLRQEIILDEKYGLCPRVKPPQSGRRYPSLPHWLAQKRQRLELRGEELRLLYVAMTRARDTLVLSACVSETKWDSAWTKPEPVTRQNIVSAACFADWLGLWFAQNSGNLHAAAKSGQTADFCWRWVEDEELTPGQGTANDVSAVAAADSMSASHDLLDPTAAERIRSILTWKYPHEPATKRAAKSSVTQLRRQAEAEDDEAEKLFIPGGTGSPDRARNRNGAKSVARERLTAAEIGAAHHKFLQHISLAKTFDLVAEADRLTQEHFLTPDERSVIDLAAVANFWDSEIGRKIRAQPTESVKRELPFTARFRAAEIESFTGRPAEGIHNDDFIVVQGVADLIVLLSDEIWLLDFKTDEVRAGDLDIRTATYKPQLQLYAAALEKIFSRKVTLRALYFLAALETKYI